MKVKDKFGSVINIYQARSGKVCIQWGDGCIKLSKRDCQLFPLYDIEDFDVDLYNQAYEDAPKAPNTQSAAIAQIAVEIERGAGLVASTDPDVVQCSMVNWVRQLRELK